MSVCWTSHSFHLNVILCHDIKSCTFYMELYVTTCHMSWLSLLCGSNAGRFYAMTWWSYISELFWWFCVYLLGQKLCFFLEKVATSCGFLGPVVSQVVKRDRQFGVTFPEFLEEITNCFDYLKLETCLTCNTCFVVVYFI